MCCCCPRAIKCFCLRPGFCKAILSIVVVAVAINAFVTFRDAMKLIEDEEEIKSSYPLLFREPGTYHNTETILRQAQRLTISNPFYGPLSYNGTDEWSLAAYGPIGNVNRADVRVAILCGQHAREIITSEICFNLIRLIQLDSAHPLFTERIAALREKGVGFWVVPVINDWGREQIESDPHKACLRKNKNGVDLNRNFPCPDLEKTDLPSNATTYAGAFDMSEPESKALNSFLEQVRPDIMFNVHSGIERVLLPYDCCSLAVHRNYKKMLEVAQLAKRSVAANTPDLQYVKPSQWFTGSSSQLLYESHGTLMDYAVHTYDVPFAYTLEVFENTTDVPPDLSETEFTPLQCMRFFNPEAGKPYEEVNIAWLDFIISLIEHTLERFELVTEK